MNIRYFLVGVMNQNLTVFSGNFTPGTQKHSPKARECIFYSKSFYYIADAYIACTIYVFDVTSSPEIKAWSLQVMSPSMYFLEMQERKMLGSEVCTTICICIDQSAGSWK